MLEHYTDTQLMIIKAKQAIIESTKGTIFSCVFVKKDGSLREMQCIYKDPMNASEGNPNRHIGFDHVLVQEVKGVFSGKYEDRAKTINLATVKEIRERGNIHVYN